jgi:hypothetical protein
MLQEGTRSEIEVNRWFAPVRFRGELNSPDRRLK